MAALRAKGVAIPRPPDEMANGKASCTTDEQCFGLGLGPGPKSVWLLEWTRDHPAAEWGQFVVDAMTGEVLYGRGGP